jgi:nucleoside-diphosphate-sugar epimerase
MNRILITGATGFIGGRLAEMACERNIPAVALVRTWSHAARLSRLPVRMVQGDILNPDSLRAAMQGCDVVFHCAVDNNAGGQAHRRVSVEGTANVMQVALEMGVKRAVHLSSTAVFGYRPEPDAATEVGVYRYSGDDYCDGKIDGEKEALRYCQEYALPVTILRPTIVYGPFSFWNVHAVAAIREGRMVLVDGAKGVCNSLYVDNLVEAMFLAAEHESAVGEVFHISDARPITWRDFIEAHARVLGDSYLPLPEMAAQEIAATWPQATNHSPSSLEQTLRLIRDPRTRRALRSIPAVERSVHTGKAIARSLLPAPVRRSLRQKLLGKNANSSPDSNNVQSISRPLLSQDEVDMFATFDKIVFSIEKARRVLGYSPKIDFSDGMERTAAWINWARL